MEIKIKYTKLSNISLILAIWKTIFKFYRSKYALPTYCTGRNYIEKKQEHLIGSALYQISSVKEQQRQARITTNELIPMSQRVDIPYMKLRTSGQCLTQLIINADYCFISTIVDFFNWEWKHSLNF